MFVCCFFFKIGRGSYKFMFVLHVLSSLGGVCLCLVGTRYMHVYITN